MNNRTLHILLCLLCYTTIALSNPANKEGIVELLVQAQQLEEEEKFDQSLAIYNEALSLALKQGQSDNLVYINKKIGAIYFKKKNYNKAKKYLKECLTLPSNTSHQADAHLNLALIYRKQSKKDSLLFHLQESVVIYKNLESSNDKFEAYKKAGILYKNNANYDKGLSLLLEAYDWFESQDNKPSLASVCNTIGAIQRIQQHYEIAEKYYRKSLQLREQLQDSFRIATAHNNLANLFKEAKQYDSATAHYQKAIDYNRDLKNSKELGRMYNNLASTYYLKEDHFNAQTYYKKALVFKKKERDTASLSNTYNELANLSLVSKDVRRAKQYLDSSTTYLPYAKGKEFELRYLEVASNYFKAIGDFKTANQYNESYLVLYKEVFSQKQSQTIQHLQEAFESKKNELKISELTRNNKEQKFKLASRDLLLEKKNLTIIAMLLFIAILLLLFYVFRQRQKRKENQAQLEKMSAVFKGEEQIKQRISKDLHDIITTSYDGIRLKVLSLKNKADIAPVADTIAREITDINQQIRLISHRLSPLGNRIAKEPLSEIIESQLGEFELYRKIYTDIQQPLPSVINHMKLSSQTNFYGIVLEILSNVEKHSKATRLELSHSQNDKELQFEFSDNGIGMHHNDQHKGIGMINIRKRVTLLGGTMHVMSSDSGTKTHIKFPIKENLSANEND